jgi:drug/metabolite transporter (DMT)-like permease
MTVGPSPSAGIWGLLIFLGLIWGSSFMAVAIALEGFTPLQVAAIRISLAALLLSVFALATGRRPPGRDQGLRIWVHITGFAVFTNAMPFALLSWGQLYVASGFAGVTMAVVPLLVLPLAHVFVPSDRMTRAKSLGFLAGFAGAVILIGPSAMSSTGESFESLARIACIAAAACYAIGSIVTRTAPPGTGMVAFGASALVIASILIVPYTLVVDGMPTFDDTKPLAAVLYLAVFPTALATLLLVQIIRRAGPSFLSLVNYQVPVWSVIFGAVLLGERLPAQIFIALALILAGLFLAQFAGRRKAT